MKLLHRSIHELTEEERGRVTRTLATIKKIAASYCLTIELSQDGVYIHYFDIDDSTRKILWERPIVELLT